MTVFLEKLYEFKVDRTIMRLIYESLIHSVMTFCISCWYGNMSGTLKHTIDKIEKCASKIIGDNVRHLLSDNYADFVNMKLSSILTNDSHCLFNEFNFLRSGVRLQTVRCRTNRLRNSFVPNVITLYNNNNCR